MFSTNSMFLYGIAVFVILFVLAQSLFFLVRAYRRGREIRRAAHRRAARIVRAADAEDSAHISLVHLLIEWVKQYIYICARDGETVKLACFNHLG